MAEKFMLLNDAEKQLLIGRYSDLEFVDDTDRLKCVRCRRIPIIHYFTNCDHLLCLNCKTFIDNGGFTCPQCNRLITNTSEQRVEFESQLHALRSKCPNTKYGCQITTNLAQIPEHIKSCEFSKEAALPALLKNKDTTQMMMENLKLLREEMEVMKAEASQKLVSIEAMMENSKLLREEMEVMKAEAAQKLDEMQTNFNSQMEMQKKIYNDALQKLVTIVKNLESPINKTSQIAALDDVVDGLQNAQDETNTILKNAMKLKEFVIKLFNKIVTFFDYKSRSGTKKEVIKNEVNKKEVNMLLMGQTGNGKSTFINALAYYLNCSDLEEAKTAELNCVIPCSFALNDANYEERIITYGNANDGNENTQSGTQKCKSYLFEMDEFILRLIDTPGIGDTRGIDQDKLNMDNILSYISPISHLHGICVLLQPNVARLTATFEYCLKQLLCHLHKNAGKNIIFVFTNSRGSFYKPGDTIVPLRAVINKLKDSADIPLNDNNIVCLDNEAFRYLIALKNNYPFENDVFNNFNESWKKSVTQYWRMINLITDKDRIPHSTEETLTLNDIKEMIITQSKPISDISKLIQQNYISLSNHLKELRKYTRDCEEFESKLYVPMIKPKINEFKESKNVCTSEACRRIVDKDGIKQYFFPTICHSPCNLKNVPRNTEGLEELKKCSVFKGGENCTKCSCSYLKHRHVYYLIELIYVKDEINETKLEEYNDFKDKFEIVVKACEEKKKKLKEEENVIIQNSAKLAIFFKQNAILPYNDAFCNYLKLLIENEESLQADGANNDSVIKGLKNMEERYLKEKEAIENSCSSSSEKISVEEAKRLIEELFNLEFSGVVLKLILSSRFIARANEVNDEEIKVPIKIRRCPQQ